MTFNPTPWKPAPVAKPEDVAKIDALCALIVGGMSKTKATEEVFGSGWKLWEITSRHSDLATKVAQAQEIESDRLADEGLEIVDTDPDPQRAKNRADYRKWLASKRKPKTYGDRLELQVEPRISILAVLEEARQRCYPLQVQRWREQGLIAYAEIVLDPDTHLPINEAIPDPDIFT